jgi:hypothetical protein
LIAASFAVSNVGPVPKPTECVIGHHDFTLMSFANACAVRRQENASVNATSFCMMWPHRKIKPNSAQPRMAQKGRQYTLRLAAKIGIAIALTIAQCTLIAGTPAAMQNGGISIEVQRLKDRVLFCVRSDEDHKVASDFGIEFGIKRGDPAAWREKMPKLVSAPGWYFALPLAIELSTRADPGGQELHVELGACSVSTDTCDKLEFDVPIPNVAENARKCAATES